MEERIKPGMRVLENEKCVPEEAEENMDRLGYNIERLLTRYSSGTVLGERVVLNTTAGIRSMQEFKQICR